MAIRHHMRLLQIIWNHLQTRGECAQLPSPLFEVNIQTTTIKIRKNIFSWILGILRVVRALTY